MKPRIYKHRERGVWVLKYYDWDYPFLTFERALWFALEIVRALSQRD